MPPAGREPWLRKDRLTLQWAGDERAVVDAVRFEVLGANREGYAQAVAFYHGDFLESLADDEWIVAHRDRLRDRHSRCSSRSSRDAGLRAIAQQRSSTR